jgi:hypothetical protein
MGFRSRLDDGTQFDSVWSNKSASITLWTKNPDFRLSPVDSSGGTIAAILPSSGECETISTCSSITNAKKTLRGFLDPKTSFLIIDIDSSVSGWRSLADDLDIDDYWEACRMRLLPIVVSSAGNRTAYQSDYFHPGLHQQISKLAELVCENSYKQVTHIAMSDSNVISVESSERGIRIAYGFSGGGWSTRMLQGSEPPLDVFGMEAAVKIIAFWIYHGWLPLRYTRGADKHSED